MKKNLLFISLLIISSFLFTSTAQESMSALDIMKKNIGKKNFKGLEIESTYNTIDDQGREKGGKIYMASKTSDDGSVEKRLIELLEPDDMKGTIMLILDYDTKEDEMWIYMPALKKPRRVVSNKRGKSFMGTEFTLGDMAVTNIDDFKYTLMGSETIDGVECWIVECTPSTNQVASKSGYSKKVLHIGKNDYITRKGMFYDRNGALNKVLTAGNVKKVDPASSEYMAFEMAIENVQNGKTSSIVMNDVSINHSLNDEIFTVESLEKKSEENQQASN